MRRGGWIFGASVAVLTLGCGARIDEGAEVTPPSVHEAHSASPGEPSDAIEDAETEIPEAPPPLTMNQRLFMGGSVYAAAIPEAHSVIAIAMGPYGRVDAYVCGDETTYATHSRWFCGDREGTDEDPTISIATDGWLLEGAIEADRVVATLTDPEGVGFDVVADIAPAESLTNIYEASDAGCRTGFIVIDDGVSEPHYSGTWCSRTGSYGQVQPLTPIDWSAPAIDVIAAVPTLGERLLSVTPLVP